MSIATTAPAGEAAQPPEADFSWRSEAYAWAVVVLLTLSFTLSMVDRLLLTLLVGPLKADFGLSDTQVSLLHGLAFTVLYVLAGLPLGRLADSRSRRTIAGVSVFAWSLMTAACGVAGNMVQLFVARAGVGVGEAGLSPAANSLMADYFPPERLSRPITFYSIGATGGAGIAYMFGGAVIEYVSGFGMVDLPVFGSVHGWQLTFLIAAAPGLLIALLFLFVREPKRTGRVLSAGQSVPPRQVWAFIRRNKLFLAPHFAAAALLAFAALGMQAWMPTLLIRRFGLTAGEAGLQLGSLTFVASITGLLFGGWLSDRLAQRGVADSALRVAFGFTVVAIVPAVVAPMMPLPILTMVCAAVAGMSLGSAIALMPVPLQRFVPNEMRGQVFAVYLLVISCLGYAVGPLSVALLTDRLFADEMMVGQSLSLIAAISIPVAAVLLRFATKRYNPPQAH